MFWEINVRSQIATISTFTKANETFYNFFFYFLGKFLGRGTHSSWFYLSFVDVFTSFYSFSPLFVSHFSKASQSSTILVPYPSGIDLNIKCYGVHFKLLFLVANSCGSFIKKFVLIGISSRNSCKK